MTFRETTIKYIKDVIRAKTRPPLSMQMPLSNTTTAELKG